MARPTKQGIDYFPIDCQFDDKIEIYITEKEATGLAVLVTVWQMIYHNEGYYIVNNKDLHLLIKRRINVDINEVNDCINLCLIRNIFDSGLRKKYNILTSKAIQKRYFEAAQRKKTVLYDVKYIINGINVCKNAVNVQHQSLYVNVKEDVKEDVKRDSRFIIPSILEIKDYCSPRNNGIDAEAFWNHYQSKGWMIGKNKMKDWKAAVVTWEKRNGEPGQSRASLGDRLADLKRRNDE